MIEQKKEESNINGFKVHNVIRDRSKSDFDNSGIGDGDPSLIGGIVVGCCKNNLLQIIGALKPGSSISHFLYRRQK